MKMSIISVIALLISVSVGSLEAQDHQAGAEAIRKKISEDVTIAAKEANIGANAALIEAFVDVGSSQIGSFRQVYASVPKNDRVARLAQYLTAKAQIGGIPANVTINDLGDFHWGYIARDMKYSPLRLETSKAVKLLTVESTGGPYNFSVKSESIKPGTVILFPTAPAQELVNVSATFKLGNQKAIWTGNPEAGKLKVVSATTSKGCEIFINSVPPKAAVYFNGKEWYARTNTSAVRDPGSWEVKVRLNGYKEWREQQNLLAGESWTINASLLKQ